MSDTGDFVHEPCLNCGDTTPGRYCRACGQRKGEVRISMRRLLADVLEDQLSINAALPRTLAALFVHPGRLTAEYSRGRISSYIAPFRLYLVASLIFFLTASVASRAGIARADVSMDEVAEQLEGDASTSTGTAGGDSSAVATAQSQSADTASRATERPGGRSSIGIFFTDEDMRSDSIDWSRAINTGVPVLDEMIEERARSLGRMEPREAIRQLAAGFFEYAPIAMFALLPVFALLLKLFYVRSGRYYVEHFVFSLHYHAFAFLLFTAIILLPDGWLPGLLLIWLFLYLPIAMKRVYGQRLWKTLAKWWVLSTVYGVLVVLGMFATAVVAFLMG